ncbi:MAG: deoxyribodipyrimidine photo-lyase [Chitinophagales bacterium]|nr:MAG: deoxyribodipyrimidine photo-lyase [Chitinophagales bacterium]
MVTNSPICIFWFRRDLRLQDNAGLYHALRSGLKVLPLFVFDIHILNRLQDRDDRRVEFIHHSLVRLNEELNNVGSTLTVMHDTPLNAFKKITEKYRIGLVVANHDYEPYAIERDNTIKRFLQEKGIPFKTYKDQVIFEKEEIRKDYGEPYTVFTPYSKKWKEKLSDFYLKPYPCHNYYRNFVQSPSQAIPSLKDIGFKATGCAFPPALVSDARIRNYDKTRDFPFLNGTSRLSVHLRFGTISIRALAARALQLNETFLNELIWREFYQMILYSFPHVVHSSFKPQYDRIAWINNEVHFQKWCEGKTGFPIVDAGMRELNATGYMHNRLRMITASFLTKQLLIDWRWGEAYFARKLLDYELASNNGGWQWAAGTGTDAAPYFRIFNPQLQARKFDPQQRYIRQWIPELGTTAYPLPIVDNELAVKRALQAYKEALARH